LFNKTQTIHGKATVQLYLAVLKTDPGQTWLWWYIYYTQIIT